MPQTLKRALVALNAFGLALMAISIVVVYLPPALSSLNRAYTFVCVLICLPLPFLVAFEACGGFKGAARNFSYIPLITNLAFLFFAGGVWFQGNPASSGMHGIEPIMLTLAPLSLLNFVALLFAPKRDA